MTKAFLTMIGCCFCLLPQVLQAQDNVGNTDPMTAKLDEYITSWANAYKFNGSVLIAENGKIILQKGYGWKNFADHTRNNSSTVFPICSLTKPFTAMVVLKLQEEGKLSVNDPLSKYFPDYPYGNKIKLSNLLDHTSGIYNYTINIDKEDSAIICHPVKKKLILDIFYHKPLDFTPGTKFKYDNSGYYLLGMVIEKVTGISYEQAVRKIIFDPLQMDHSGFDFSTLMLHPKQRDMISSPPVSKCCPIPGILPSAMRQALFTALPAICINGQRR